MISVFRNFNPINVLWLVIMLVLTRICYLYTGPAQVELTLVESFARSLLPLNYVDMISLPLNMLLAGILVLAQAILLNYVVNHYNLISKPSFLPALMYVTVSGLFTPFLTVSPPLICNFLVIWMVFKLLSFYKGGDVKSTTYDLGMIVALGSIFYLPYIYLFLVIWIALLIFRPFDWRDWVAAIMGYVTVFFFLAVFYYLTDRIHSFYQIWVPLGSKFPNSIHIFNYKNYLLLIPVAVILVLCLFRLRANFFKSFILVRKSFQMFFSIFIVAGLAFYIKADFRLNHFLLCAVPISVFFAYYFLHATTRWIYESLYFLLLVGIIYFQF
ncbi:beta-carotene 15,15'-monooxygenase [Mucilaginibacter mali]|uniref:Beta-carotene 15,15'-monooxygenase n=1 Tax=Mucilaginibacter mali TaxID=2740462 RepID=A0A7D4QNZ4_9SPHI|nr:DUF6427 family protein [Mucilaginibacter mali]QKJ28249.1 beta-carotene 15,15'-monooxygenase [Mucilaginibacter mali]